MNDEDYMNYYDDLSNMSFEMLNDESDFEDDSASYNSISGLSKEDMNALLSLGEEDFMDETEEDDEGDTEEQEDEIEEDDLKERDEATSSNNIRENNKSKVSNQDNSEMESTNASYKSFKDLYNPNNIKMIKDKAIKEEERKKAVEYKEGKKKEDSQINNDNIDSIVKQLENVTKVPEYYKINYLNVHRCIFELSEDKEWIKFLKENYEGQSLEQLYGMTTFSTVKRIYEEDKKTIKEDRPVITTEFLNAIHNFYKKENYILVPIYSKEDLTDEDIYISTQTKQFYWYNKDKKRDLYKDITGKSHENINKRDYYNFMRKETLDFFVSFDLANYCYNDNGRLTFYQKGYKPKYILDENVKFIRNYISDIDRARELYSQ